MQQRDERASCRYANLVVNEMLCCLTGFWMCLHPALSAPQKLEVLWYFEIYQLLCPRAGPAVVPKIPPFLFLLIGLGDLNKLVTRLLRQLPWLVYLEKKQPMRGRGPVPLVKEPVNFGLTKSGLLSAYFRLKWPYLQPVLR